MFFVAILLLSMIGYIATDVYLPSMPSIVQELSTTKKLVQFTFVAYLLPFGISQLYYGPLSEKIGRKKTVLYALIFMVVGSVICIFSPNIYILILGRFLEGVGVGAGTVVCRAILRDVYKGDALSQVGAHLSIGQSVCASGAPLVGGYIQQYLGWRYNFVFIVLYTVINIFIVYFFLKETHKDFNPHADKVSHLTEKYISIIKNPIFMSYAGCGTCAFGGLAAYLILSPFLFQNVLALTSVEYGWLAIYISVGICIGGFINSIFVKKIGRHQLLRFGAFAQILGGIAMLLPVFFGTLNVACIIVPMVIYMFGNGLVFTNTFAGAFHFFTNAGFAGALYGAIQILGGTLFAVIMSFIHADDQMPLAIILVIVGIITFILQKIGHTLTLKHEKKSKPSLD